MSWIQSILRALNEEEIARVKNIKLIGKEKQVFDYFLNRMTEPDEERDGICKELELSESHFYKINSILIDKIYFALCEDDHVELLKLLRRKEMYALLKHEIQNQTKEIHKSADREYKRKYYLEALRLLIDLPFKYYNDVLIENISEKYLDALDNSSEGDALYIKFHKLFAECNRCSARKNPKKSFGYSINDLKEFERELEATNFHLAKYYLFRTLSSYYNYYEKQPVTALDYLQKATALKDDIAYFFPIDVGTFLSLLQADLLLTIGRTDKAYAIYKQAFKKGMDETMYGYFYHCEQYATLALRLKEYEKAESILNEHFSKCIENRKDIYATRGLLAYIKLYLITGDNKKALHFVNLAKEINEKSFYLPFDLQLRVLENLCFFFKGDVEFAKQLANRNIKFALSQENVDMLKEYLEFWKITLAFINCMEKNTPIPDKVKKDYKELEARFTPLYANLPHLMREKMVEITKNPAYLT